MDDDGSRDGRGRPSLPPPPASMKNMEMIFLLSFFKSGDAIGGCCEGRDGEDGWITPFRFLVRMDATTQEECGQMNGNARGTTERAGVSSGTEDDNVGGVVVGQPFFAAAGERVGILLEGSHAGEE